MPTHVAATTLDAFAGDYFRAKAPTLAPSTIKAREEAYRLRISPSLGGEDLVRVDRRRVEVWLAETLATASPHAAWKAVGSLRAMLKLAVEWGFLEDNPAPGLRLPKRRIDHAAAERVLTAEQLELLVSATRRARVETMIRAAGEGGLRLGEVIGLRWPDVDLPNRRLTIARSVWQEAARGNEPLRRIVGPPKSGRERRVAISSSLAARLGEWYAESVVEGGAPADGYVWPARAGGPMDRSTPGQALARLLERAGLVGAEGRPLITFHGLRHTAASIMLSRDVPLIVVSRQLGHANPNITAQVYAHLLSDSQLDAAAAAFEPRIPADTLRETLREGLDPAEKP
ncbi:MAG: tyrosine-type recombinase/integrase [Thermoleophilia bacterium]